MHKALLAATLLSAALFAGCASSPDSVSPPADHATDSAVDDVVVIAVIDSGFNPYHWDFLASKMPQHLNADTDDDLPLDQDPSTWVPGYPAPSTFASYGALNLTLDGENAKAVPNELHTADEKAWDSVKTTTINSVNMRWIPGTKVIGAITFGSGDGYNSGSHGVGTSSVSVGNLHGSCPHCLLVFVDGLGEDANRWVEQQDWIDAQTNSWGFSSSLVLRDRIYAGSDTEAQRMAVDRGQSIFFSAGNGIDGGYAVTNPTIFSSQEGPDWITTVGAILPDGTITGAGKPSDVSSLGGGYPSAYGATTVNETKNFGGTSNATPVTAGLYGEALYQLRRELIGPSRMQANGTIAQGPAGCGPANADCALADGNLTVHELREALFRSANQTGLGYSQAMPAGPDPVIPQSENAKELIWLGAGHGAFWGHMRGEANLWAEVARIAGFASGQWNEAQDPEQVAWFVADSLCRQGGWGAWEHGYAQKGPAPTPNPQWPVRTWMSTVCPEFLGAAVMVEKQVAALNPLA